MSWDSLAVNAATIRGVEAFRVSCEVSCSGGIPGISIVGLPDGSVLEARTRVRCAIRNCGFELPRLHITVNLAPAELRKTGTGFDLPLAVGILAATGQIPRGGLDGLLFVGELGLDGSVNESRGMVAYRHLADSLGLRLVCAPESPVGPDPQRTLGLSNLRLTIETWLTRRWQSARSSLLRRETMASLWSALPALARACLRKG